MYPISDQQIEFIQSDIRTRGIAMVSLQQDLLDHICCVIERELEPDGDFHEHYLSVIRRFYQAELKEIENETVHLLINKNYYKMKKTMITGGVTSVALLTAGIVLKFLYLPGASLFIVLGIFILSFIFLPLMFILRMGEKQEKPQKIISVIGGICAMLISLGILFKIMHWPGANMMCVSSLLLMIFVFIPIYFFSGFRNPATKVNTTVSSIMMFTGCILILTLIRAPHATHKEYVQQTREFLINDESVRNEKRLSDGMTDSSSEAIYQSCQALKSFLIKCETGQPSLASDFETRETLIGDTWTNEHFSNSPDEMKKLNELKAEITRYNQSEGLTAMKIDTDVFNLEQRVQSTLMSLNQIQLTVLQNKRELVAVK